MGDLLENGVLENVVVALGKRCPGFLLDIVLFHESCFIPFLVPDVRLDLVDSRLYLVAVEKIREALIPEARHADGADAAFLVEAFHSTPGPVIIAIRFVDEVKVEVIETKFLH